MATKKKKMKKSKKMKAKKRPMKKPGRTSRSSGHGKAKKAKAKRVKTAKRSTRRGKKTRAQAKKVVSKRPAGKKAAKKAIKAVKQKMLGKVVHYYDKIGVAIVELESPLRVGETVLFKRGMHEHMQTVASMQINREPILAAKKGDVVGVQVSQEIGDGSLVLPA